VKWRWDTNSVDVFPITLGKNREKTKHFHMYCRWRSRYQGRGWNTITDLIRPHVCACSKPDVDFQRHMSWSFCFVFSERSLFALLILVELLTITVWTFFNYKQTMQILHIFASTQKDHMLSQNEWQHKHEQHNSQ
jgi:hypothetical protein